MPNCQLILATTTDEEDDVLGVSTQHVEEAKHPLLGVQQLGHHGPS